MDSDSGSETEERNSRPVQIAGVGLSPLERAYLDEVSEQLRRRGCSRREQSRAAVIRLHIHDAATFFDLPPSVVELLLADMKDRGIETRATYFKQLLSDQAKVLSDRAKAGESARKSQPRRKP